jgi:hypothetical protein
MGTAASDGRFRIERSGFSSPTCRITVSDGATSTQVSLAGCTPANSAPPPPPPAPPSSTTASFRGLGHLPGWITSQALGVSPDGSTVVGYGNDASRAARPFRWTAAGGLEDLGTSGEARAASFDGSAVFGQGWEAATGYFGFRWRSGVGIERLPLTDVADVSADGSVIVTFGIRWTEAGGSQPLGDFGGGYTSALGVSPDGGVVVGHSENASRFARAFAGRPRPACATSARTAARRRLRAMPPSTARSSSASRATRRAGGRHSAGRRPAASRTSARAAAR